MIANGWKVGCRQAGPPGSVMIGAITFASCARHATATRSLCRSSEISRLPTTTASVTLYSSSIRRGATSHWSCGPSVRRDRSPYQTFHSSKEMPIFLLLLSSAPTWSAVATTASMKRSMFTAEARNDAVSPSSLP